MKNIFKNSYKSVAIVVLLVIAVAVPSFGSASGTASFSSNGVFKIGDHRNAGTTNWVTSLSNMKPGDQVQFLFTYLNTSSNTANGALSSYSVSGNGTAALTVTGTIWASNAPQVSGSVTIYAASGYTISLNSDPYSGGPGDVFPGANEITYHSTSVVTLGGNQIAAQQPTAQLWAEYPNGTTVTQVPLGTAPFMHWTSTNATECHVLAGAGFSTGGATQGQDQVSPLAGSTTFSIQCTGTGGSIQANYTVTVTTPQNNLTCNSFSAYPSSGQSPLTATLSANASGGAGGYTYQYIFGDGQSQNFISNNSVQHTYITSQSQTFSANVTAKDSDGATCSASTSVYVSATYTPPPPPSQPTAHISANPTSVNSGNSTTLQWSSTNAASCQGNGFSTGNTTSGNVVSSPLTNTTTFSVTCTNSSGSAYDSVTVYVNSTPPPPPSGSAPSAQTLSATGVSQNSATLNGSVNSNQAATSYWFEYGTSQSLGNSTGYQSAGSGSSAINVNSLISGLIANTTYYFRVVAQNSYGTAQGSILSLTTSGGGGGSGSAPTVITGGAAGISQTSAQITGYVDPNGYQTSYWFEYGTSQSLGSATGFQSAGAGTDSLPYNATLSNLSQNTTYYYRIVAQNTYGTSQGSILSFTTSGGGGGNNCVAPSVQTLSANNTYQNSAQLNGSVNPNNCQTSYWFEYGTNYSLGNTTGYQSAGASSGSFNIYSSISGLNYNQTYYFRAVAQNSAGTSYGSILSFSTNNSGCTYGNCGYGNQLYVQTLNATNYGNNTITFNGSVNPNSTYSDSVYGWFEYGTNINSLYLSTNSTYIGSGNYQQNFSQTAYNIVSGTTYYYRAAARNSSGTSYGQILSTSNYGGNGAPQVITNAATYISRTSALLNGQVDANNSATNAWFEYGTTVNLGSQTISQSAGMGNDYQNYSSALSSLSANTTYYFRAAAQNSYGTSYGTILSFMTSGGGTTTYIPQQQTVVVRTINTGTGTGTGLSCVILVPSLNVSELTPGQNFTLTVTYRNGCTYNLSNVFLKVILPQGTDFVLTNYPFFNRDANGISYNLGALPTNFQSAISIEGTVSNSANPGDSMIFSAVLNFNDEQGRFQSISSYLTAVVGQGKVLGANVLATFGNLFGNWIFDLLLIALIIFLVYLIFSRKRNNVFVSREGDVLEAKPLTNV